MMILESNEIASKLNRYSRYDRPSPDFYLE
jgi:hypothetical protein